MKLSELKTYLADRQVLTIALPDGGSVPDHFHVTEIGEATNHYVDCGGTVRHKKVVNFQLWSATDYDHRLKGDKLREIISLAERELGLGDLEIEVEYQGQHTIEKYGLEVADGMLRLTGQTTDCLAPDKCGIPQKTQISLDSLVVSSQTCQPGSGCC